jgi:O-acetyl-ADP-ribose deacetylase (regulator of RNase III)
MANIELVHGDLLSADAEALVNTVNTVGVMGKGIALQFKKAYPDNYTAYKHACDAGDVVPGRMFVFQTGRLESPQLIINFPTKRHWRGRARIGDVRDGLVDLVRVIRELGVRSVAVPPLGCGNGGLDWREVKPIIEEALRPLDNVTVLLHEPAGAPLPEDQKIGTDRPELTSSRAALLAALDTYLVDPMVTITPLVMQKVSYLLQTAGEPLNLAFAKAKFGPYAENLNQVIQRIDGHFITGAGDRSEPSPVKLVPEAVAAAWALLADDKETRVRIDRVHSLVSGFESPLGLELLTTVHWAATQDGASSPEEALRVVGSWTERKRRTFSAQHVAAAWERLDDQGWIPAAATPA